MRWLDRLGFYDEASARSMVTGWASSVTDLVNVAVRFGYRNVVLCGVDLNDSRYFYDVDAAYYAGKGVPLPANIYDTTKKHVVNTKLVLLPEHPEWGAVTLTDVLKMMQNVVLAPRGIRMHVALRTSALHPDFPAYFV